MTTDIKYGVLYQLDGWHMVIKFPEGNEMISTEGYRTQEECREAFEQWRKDQDNAS